MDNNIVQTVYDTLEAKTAEIAATRAEYDKMEEKADHMLDMANARAELNNSIPDTEALADVAKKYEDNTDIDNELAALKSQLGL